MREYYKFCDVTNETLEAQRLHMRKGMKVCAAMQWTEIVKLGIFMPLGSDVVVMKMGQSWSGCFGGAPRPTSHDVSGLAPFSILNGKCDMTLYRPDKTVNQRNKVADD